MVRELQIIFGLDTIARELRVARHALVFLKQLGGIAALPIVLAVARLSAEILPPLSTSAAPAAALTIVDQMSTSLRSKANPLASVGQGGAVRCPDLSFRSAHEKRETNGRLRRGWSGARSAFLKGAGTGPVA